MHNPIWTEHYPKWSNERGKPPNTKYSQTPIQQSQQHHKIEKKNKRWFWFDLSTYIPDWDFAFLAHLLRPYAP